MTRKAIETGLFRVSFTAALALAVFSIYVAAFGVFDNIIVSGLTILLALVYGFASWHQGKGISTWLIVLHGIGAAACAFLILAWGGLMFEQEQFFVSVTTLQHIYAWSAIALTAYITYRYYGIPMVLVVGVAALYVLAPS